MNLLKSPDTLRIVLIGKTGVGKSATGNTIVGKKVFNANLSDKSVTSECQTETAEVCGRHITVIDTPGLFDTNTDYDEIREKIVKCISMAAPGPHAFLLVLRLGRFTQEEREAVRIIEKLFGEKCNMYTIVLFTGGDMLEGETVDQYVGNAGEHLRAVLSECGDRYHAFNNKEKTSSTQVLTLLNKINEMVRRNGGSYYTNEMFQQAEIRAETLAFEEDRKTHGDSFERLWKETINTLKGGICSLIEVYNALIQTEKDPVTGQRCNIGEHIVQAHNHLQRSEEMARSALKRLDKIKYIEKTIEELREKKVSNERKLSDSEKGLERAREEKTSLKQKIRDEEKKMDAAQKILDNGELISGIGTGLLALPVAGWIAGPIMMADGESKINQAARAVREAEWEMKTSEIESESLIRDIKHYEDSIPQTREIITQTERMLKEKKEELEKAKKEIKLNSSSVDELQRKVKNAITVLGVLKQSVSMAKDQICRSTLAEPLIKVMKDVMKATEKITGNELLDVHDVPRLISQMKGKHQRLADTNNV